MSRRMWKATYNDEGELVKSLRNEWTVNWQMVKEKLHE